MVNILQYYRQLYFKIKIILLVVYNKLVIGRFYKDYSIKYKKYQIYLINQNMKLFVRKQ